VGVDFGIDNMMLMLSYVDYVDNVYVGMYDMLY